MANGTASFGNCVALRCDKESFVLFVFPQWKTTPPFLVAGEIEDEVSAVVVFNHHTEGFLLTSGLWKFSPNLPKKRVFVTDIDKPYNFVPGWLPAQMGQLDEMIKVHPLPDHFIVKELELFLDIKTRSFVKTVQQGEKGLDPFYYGYVGSKIKIDKTDTDCSHIYGSIAKGSLKKASELWIAEKNFMTINFMDDNIHGNRADDIKIFKPKKYDRLPHRNGIINPDLIK